MLNVIFVYFTIYGCVHVDCWQVQVPGINRQQARIEASYYCVSSSCVHRQALFGREKRELQAPTGAANNNVLNIDLNAYYAGGPQRYRRAVNRCLILPLFI